MRTDYSAPEIDVVSAQRQAAEAQVIAAENFVSVRELTAGAGNLSTGTRASKPASGALNDFFFETDTHWLYYWSGTAWLFMAGLNFGTNATRAAITVSADDNGAHFFTTDQNKLWRVEGGAWADKFVSLDLTTSLKVSGTKVVGTRGAAVADVASPDATDLATALTLVNELKAQVNLGFARLRSTTGHGLWT